MDTTNNTKENDQSNSDADNQSANQNTNKTGHTEEFKVSGDGLLKKVKELIHEGNIRRVVIKNESGETLIEFPVTLGVVGVALLPVWAAVGAIAALVSNCTIVVERRS